MSWLLTGAIVVPLACGVLGLLLRPDRAKQQLVSLVAAIAHLGIATSLLVKVWSEGILVAQVGGWPAPFGITLVADHLSSAMVLITSIIGAATIVYACCDIDERSLVKDFHPPLQALVGSVCGAFLTGDIFNLYVWFEVMLIASLALLISGGRKAQLDGAVRYAALSLVATTLFLSGIGLLYGMTGTLNMADLHLRVQQVENQGLLSVVAILFIVAFGIKAAVFPLFFWLPASYHTPKVAVSAIFAGLLTKVGVYSMIRVFTLIFTHDVGYTHGILLWIAGLTMVTGVLGAASHNEFRRILSFHIISQIGYMVLGLALFTPLALVGAVFYILHHILVKANLFFVAGAAERLSGSSDLKTLGGVYREQPLLAALFFVSAFSLAGFPPLSGFWAKLFVIKASFASQQYWVAAVALAVGLLTMYSMTKIWLNGFWKARPASAEKPPPLSQTSRALLLGPIICLAAMTLAIGLWPGPLYDLAERAGRELMNPSNYVEAVLGSSETADFGAGAGVVE